MLLFLIASTDLIFANYHNECHRIPDSGIFCSQTITWLHICSLYFFRFGSLISFLVLMLAMADNRVHPIGSSPVLQLMNSTIVGLLAFKFRANHICSVVFCVRKALPRLSLFFSQKKKKKRLRCLFLWRTLPNPFTKIFCWKSTRRAKEALQRLTHSLPLLKE